MAKMTLIGFYNYMQKDDSDLFLNLSLPDGIDKETVINTILLRGSEFEVIYSNPYFLRDSITTWSKKWYWTFNRWLKAINTDYNPLENYDRMEEWSDGNTYSDNSNGSATGNASSSSNTSSENTTSAFNSDQYQPRDKNTATLGNSSNNFSSSNEAKNGSNSSTHKGRVHGNIGVMTSSQMLENDFRVVGSISLYDAIADVFLREYVIPLY